MIQGHVKAAKHADGKRRLERKDVRERDITVALRKHGDEVHQKGETLPESQQMYRVKVATAFLHAGVPNEKVDCFESFLKRMPFV